MGIRTHGMGLRCHRPYLKLIKFKLDIKRYSLDCRRRCAIPYSRAFDVTTLSRTKCSQCTTSHSEIPPPTLTRTSRRCGMLPRRPNPVRFGRTMNAFDGDADVRGTSKIMKLISSLYHVVTNIQHINTSFLGITTRFWT